MAQIGAKAALFLASLALVLALWGHYFQPSVFKELKRTPAEFFAASFVLFVLALLLWWVERKQLSRVSKPEVFRNVGNTFVGREEIEEYSALIPRTAQLWITGESGSGKSTLIHRGILPHLQEDSTLCPLYIEQWGSDWEHGPLEEVARGLQQNLLDEERAKVHWRRAMSAEELAAVLRSVPDRLNRTPVLVFDQFDDYLTAHRKKFVAPSGQVLTKDELTGQNAFWREVADLCLQGIIRTVFVTRSDIQWGRLSVRFTPDEQERVLLRLKRDMLDQLLISLDNAVENPQNGWRELRDELGRSLTAEGGVLPIQVRFVVQSLPSLPHLTPNDYRRAGGVTGLIARYFQERIDNESRAANLKPQQVRAILRSLVDVAGGSGPKTVPRPESSFARLVAPEDASKLHVTLERLQAADLVRSFAPDLNHEPAWKLDHDYLCRPLLYMEERLNPERAQLEQNAAAFANAISLRSRFGALLPPLAWLRILYARLLRRLRFGTARRYFAYSSVRLILTPYVMLPLILGYGAFKYYSKSYAHDLISGLGSGTSSEIQNLWELSGANYEVRKEALWRVLQNEAAQQQFVSSRAAQVLMAIGSLNMADRNSLVQDVVRPLCYEPESHDPSHLLACAKAAAFLDPQGQNAAHYILKWMQQEGITNISEFAVALGEVRGLTNEQAQQANKALLQQLGRIKNDPLLAKEVVREMLAINNLGTGEFDTVAHDLINWLDANDGIAFLDTDICNVLEIIANRVSLGTAEIIQKGISKRIRRIQEKDFTLATQWTVPLGIISLRLGPQAIADSTSVIVDLLSITDLKRSELPGFSQREFYNLAQSVKTLIDYLRPDQKERLRLRLTDWEKLRNAPDIDSLFDKALLLMMKHVLGACDKASVSSTMAHFTEHLENPEELTASGLDVYNAPGFAALSEYLDPATASKGAKELVQKMTSTNRFLIKNKISTSPWMSMTEYLLPDYGRAMSDGEAKKFLQVNSTLISALASGDRCAMIAGFLREENFRTGIEVLKWPACSEAAQAILLARLSDLTKQEFATPSVGAEIPISASVHFQPRWWTFLDWVHKKENVERYHL